MDNLIDWFYGQVVGFLGNFFAEMGNMGVELFDLEWVQAIVLFFSQLAWALFGVSLVVSAFEFGIEYTSGRANLQRTAIDALKGFMAVSLFTTVPVKLYALSVSLQGTFATGLTGYGNSIGTVGEAIIQDLQSVDSLADMANQTLGFGLSVLTSPFMLLFCIILMAAYSREMRQLGEPVGDGEMAERMCRHILPHQNHSVLKNRHRELGLKVQSVLARQKVSGIRSEEDKRQMAEAWLDLTVDFAKVSVKYEAEELKKWQRQQQENSLSMTM